jgi:hypothetical protein
MAVMAYLFALIAAVTIGWQLSPRMTSLVDAVRPALPYPASTRSGDLPADNSDASKWFVVWPDEAEDVAIIVRANPLHPEVQAASAEAMERINAAVAAAERRAQASYERALEQLRNTGKAGALETVSLEDEGVAGERIDAELEATIQLVSELSFDVASAESPKVEAGQGNVTWVVSVPAHTYRQTDDNRERFRAAETRLYFGDVGRPAVSRGADATKFRVDVTSTGRAFAVVARGNSDVVARIVSAADWTKLVQR